MDKSYTGRYPERRREQHGWIFKALVSMLNCRRYLAGQGFKEVFSDETWYGNNLINNISGKVVFSDGSEVGAEEFIKMKNCSERDALLERMIEIDTKFERKGIVFPFECGGYDRNNVVRTTFGDDAYGFFLSVIDTTKEGIVFPASLFMFSPKRFSFRYHVLLRKNFITDKDLEDFAKYRQGLEDSSKLQKVLLTYTSQIAQKKQTEIEVPHQKIDFVNPWEIEIPKIRGKKNE